MPFLDAIPQPCRDWLNSELDDAREWTAGRMGWVRLILWLYLIYLGINHLRDPLYGSWFSGLTLGIHELGHVVMGWGGQWIMAAGGTFWQLMVPLIAVVMFRRQRDWFGISVALCWLADSMWGMATYMADARALELPLVSLSDEAEHDWEYLFNSVGLLNQDTHIAVLVRIVTFFIWAGGIALGGWLLWRMIRHPESSNDLLRS